MGNEMGGWFDHNNGLHAANLRSLELPQARRNADDPTGKGGFHTYVIEGQLAKRVFEGADHLKYPNSPLVADYNTLTPVVLRWLERLADMRKRACEANKDLKPETMRFVTLDPKIQQLIRACRADIDVHCQVKDIATFQSTAGGFKIALSPAAQAELELRSRQYYGAPPLAAARQQAPPREWRDKRDDVLPHTQPPHGPGGSSYHHGP
jgi:hypothetical protein